VQRLAQRQLIRRVFRSELRGRLRLRQGGVRIAGPERPAGSAQEHDGEEPVRACVVDRLVLPGGALEQIDHVGQRVVGGRAPLSRLQSEGGGEPVVAHR